jgi:hypothetical protein
LYPRLFAFYPFRAGLIDTRKIKEFSLFYVSRCKRLAQKQGKILLSTRTNSSKRIGHILTA